jgi:hypothetical protein
VSRPADLLDSAPVAVLAPRRALVGLAAAATLLVIVVYVLAVRTAWGQRLDAAAVRGRLVLTRRDIHVAARHFTQADLDGVAAELNDRPRQTLRWKSPSQALDQVLR